MDDEYTQANRELWNAWTRINAASDHYDVAGFRAGKSTLNSIEQDELGEVTGKSLLHLQCHFGLDTLSWARRGAQVTGIDFADESIALATALAAETGLGARFICADIYDLPNVLTETFDIVYTSGGVLFWLKDLDRWAEIVSHFVSPGGTFYLLELHPFINIFDNDPQVTGFNVRWPYFHTPQPVAAETQGTYADPSAEYHATEYSWSFGLGEVITAIIRAGLRIEYIHEFPRSTSKRFPFMVQGDDGWWRWPDPTNTMPLLFSIKATK
jgi:SAM-dependent methyltransferase